ncbi:MAG: ribonuclease D [Actinobacteria bacterium]|nr:ribonuclease D [Actinomycetota bacterium]
MSATAHVLVADTRGLEAVTAAASAAGRIGLDTEFMREKTYRAILCLVQVAAGDDIFIIDPLEVDPEPIASLVADPSVEVLLHAARQDLELFNDRYGIVPTHVFDVQAAAGFAGYGASLSYGRLVEATLGIALEKGESYTDWCRRPLTDKQLKYAGDDVRYLGAIADRLKRDLEEGGRLKWAYGEMQALEDPNAYAADPNDAWLRVKGRGTLSGRQLAVLREIAAWREREAARRDIPRGWVVKDPTLIELARRSPTTPAALRDIRGLNSKEAERSARAIIDAVERGRRSESIKTAKSPTRSAQERARMLSGLTDAVVRSRCEAAGVATELVVTRSEVEALLLDMFSGSLDETQHRTLQGWRRDLVGDAILGLAAGKIAVKVIDRPPYVEEVPLNDG